MAAPVTLPRLLGRGAVAGGMAGLLTGAFSYLLAEPLMDRAVRLEETRHARDGHGQGAGHEHAAEIFTRAEQHLGLVVSTVAAGVALGVLFAVIYAALHGRDPAVRPWERSLRLAGAALTGVWLLPFLRYPANPPGVGDEGSLGVRTASWLGALVIGVAAVVVAWRLHAYLAGASAPVRQGAVTATIVIGLAALFLLPDNPDPVAVPAELLWDFRLLSAGASVLLWVGLGAAFGALGLRAAALGTAAGSSRGHPLQAER